MRSYWIKCNAMTGVLIEKELGTQTDADERRPCNDGDRDWGYVAKAKGC